jgi:type IV pilus assembly protein PilY1
VYAGDLLGNLWRFDLTSSSASSWAVSTPALFTTPAGQPITTKPVVWITTPTTGGTQRLMVDFGTGQKTPITNANPAKYVTGTQYLYGIWDWNMDNWNTKSSTKYFSLTAPQTVVLQTQTATIQANGALTGTSNPVCWSGTSTCSGGTSANKHFGWSLALPGTAEQVIYNPINSIWSCANTQDTGNTIAISVTTGGAIPGLFPNYKDAIGFRTDGSGSVTTVNAGGQDYWLTQSSDGPGTQPKNVCPPPYVWSNGVCSVPPKLPGPTGKRLTWIQKR